jgi:hypothetical protein
MFKIFQAFGTEIPKTFLTVSRCSFKKTCNLTREKRYKPSFNLLDFDKQAPAVAAKKDKRTISSLLEKITWERWIKSFFLTVEDKGHPGGVLRINSTPLLPGEKELIDVAYISPPLMGGGW